MTILDDILPIQNGCDRAKDTNHLVCSKCLEIALRAAERRGIERASDLARLADNNLTAIADDAKKEGFSPLGLWTVIHAARKLRAEAEKL